jgi:predicted AAA+ superfamily ATPase
VFADRAYITLTLEDPEEREYAARDPRGFLARFPDGAVLDEAQRCPDLCSYLQGMVDSRRRMGDFILTGSQQFGLLAGISQSLAGRVGLVQLLPLSVVELSNSGQLPVFLDELHWRGGYPALYDRQLGPEHSEMAG